MRESNGSSSRDGMMWTIDIVPLDIAVPSRHEIHGSLSLFLPKVDLRHDCTEAGEAAAEQRSGPRRMLL